MPYLGLSAGGAALPGVFGHTCSGECSEVIPAAGVEARLGISVRALGIELRGSSWGEAVFFDNQGIRNPQPVHESGVHEDVTYPFRKGSLSTADLRIRYAGLLDLPILLTGGGGIAAGEMPYILGSAGVQFGRGVKGLLEFEWMNLRVPGSGTTPVVRPAR